MNYLIAVAGRVLKDADKQIGKEEQKKAAPAHAAEDQAPGKEALHGEEGDMKRSPAGKEVTEL